MELILYVIMGIMIGTLIGIVSVKLFMSKPSVDYKELIKQSEQRLEIAKKHGEELDKMLEEMKK
jgi:gas vesicle protein